MTVFQTVFKIRTKRTVKKATTYPSKSFVLNVMNNEFMRKKGPWETISLKNLISKLKGYSEPCQKSKMKCFAKKVNGSKPLTFLAKRFILDV